MKTKELSLIPYCLLAVLFIGACSRKSEELQNLETQLERVEKQVHEAMMASIPAEGRRLALIEERKAVFELTAALIEQRIVAIRTGAAYVVLAPATPPDEAKFRVAKENRYELLQHIERVSAEIDSEPLERLRRPLEEALGRARVILADAEQVEFAARNGLTIGGLQRLPRVLGTSPDAPTVEAESSGAAEASRISTVNAIEGTLTTAVAFLSGGAGLFWPLMGVLIGLSAAKRKGLGSLPAAIGGLLLGPLAVLIYLVKTPKGERKRRCPSCSEWILEAANVCKHCSRDVPR